MSVKKVSTFTKNLQIISSLVSKRNRINSPPLKSSKVKYSINQAKYYKQLKMDKLMKVFAPDGRIYQMEYAFKAINTFGMTSVAVRGNDSVVVCTQKKVPDKMIVPDSITNIFNITDTIGAVIVGNMQDARFTVQLLRQFSADFKMKFAYEIPTRVLAQRLGARL